MRTDELIKQSVVYELSRDTREAAANAALHTAGVKSLQNNLLISRL